MRNHALGAVARLFGELARGRVDSAASAWPSLSPTNPAVRSRAGRGPRRHCSTSSRPAAVTAR